MEKLNTDRLFDRVSKREGRDNSKLYVVMDDANYMTYKIDLDEEKLRLLKEDLVKKYSDYETITRENVRIDGPRGISDHFIHGNIEVIDSVTTNTYSTSFGDGPVFGGPVYADVAADIKRHPAIERVISSLILAKVIDLNNLYKYICKIKSIDDNLVLNKPKTGIIKIENIGFNNSIILSNKEKEINDEELTLIINNIFNCFTIKSVETKGVVDGEIAITTAISLDELKELKETIEKARRNSLIANSSFMSELLNQNDIAKQLIHKK